MTIAYVKAEFWTKLYRRYSKEYVMGRIWYERQYLNKQIAFEYF